MAMRDALGADAIHGGEEIDSSLPLVLESSSRRSRFSDKLVDLGGVALDEKGAGAKVQMQGDPVGQDAPESIGQPCHLAVEVDMGQPLPVCRVAVEQSP